MAWILIAISVPWALFIAALSSDFYNATSPPQFGLHVLMRKVYSVGAFALVGYLIARALRECSLALTTRAIIVLGAIYSGAIEIAQFENGSQEGIWWNLFDVGCGALGGAIAARFLRAGKRAPARVKRTRRTIAYRTVRFRDDAVAEPPRDCPRNA